MDKGYIENGFIVDFSNAKKTSEIIYELSRVLDMPEAKAKNVCLKLGSIDLNQSQLISVKALIESMDSELEFITTSSDETKAAAESLGITISELENKVDAPDFDIPEEETEAVNLELESALDKIFGEGDFDERYPETDCEQRLEGLQKCKTTLPSKTIAYRFERGKPFSASNQDLIVEEEIRTEEKIEPAEVVEESEDFEEVRKHRKETEKLPTLYIQRTLRSGQSLSSEGNIVIIGDVNPGAEIVAKGDITVWGVLGGIAHAGSDGNTYSRIRALKLYAIQLRIGDIFARRPDTVNLPYVQKTDSYTPEEARVHKKHIVIYKSHEA